MSFAQRYLPPLLAGGLGAWSAVYAFGPVLRERGDGEATGDAGTTLAAREAAGGGEREEAAAPGAGDRSGGGGRSSARPG